MAERGKEEQNRGAVDARQGEEAQRKVRAAHGVGNRFRDLVTSIRDFHIPSMSHEWWASTC
eukprot:768719-Hanusia_phi.AAC.2